ncbi:hypothetical protein MMC29_000577 [Sticta canariensis]|nr:hypothetical protein [Sticta canariensis]
MAALRVVATADTHGEHEQLRIPEGDVLIHAGDFAMRNNFKHLQSGLEWFARQPHECKVMIGGNHDLAMEGKTAFAPWDRKQQEQIKAQISEYTRSGSIIYLEHESKQVTVKGRKLTIFGSPFTPWHGFGAWRYDRKEDIWQSAIQQGTDVVITHGPPYGILDRSRHGQACGCKHLMRRLQEVQPSLTVYGHIHESFGQDTCTWANGKTTVFANVAKGFPGQFPQRRSAVIFDI